MRIRQVCVRYAVAALALVTCAAARAEDWMAAAPLAVLTPPATPEPGTYAMVGGMLVAAGIVFYRRRK